MLLCLWCDDHCMVDAACTQFLTCLCMHSTSCLSVQDLAPVCKLPVSIPSLHAP